MKLAISVIGLFLLAQSGGITSDQLIETTTTPPLYPKEGKDWNKRTCRCPDEPTHGIILLHGIAVDAEVTLNADGLSPADRQATIINVNSSNTDIKGRTKIWHSTNRNQCGVTFDYGKKYSIAVRKTEQGFETDECLMRRIRTAN